MADPAAPTFGDLGAPVPNAGTASAMVAPPSPAPTAAPSAPSGLPAPPQMTAIRSNGGHQFTVDARYVPNFLGAVNDLEAAGYQIGDVQGFNPRYIAGTDVPSRHATGDAIDINPGQNQQGTSGNIPPDLARRVAAAHGLRWGGDFQNAPIDPMHFEIPAGGPIGGGNTSAAPTFADLGAFANAPVIYANQTTGAQIPNLPPISAPQAATVNLLAAHNLQDHNAPQGTMTNPEAQVAGQGEPQELGRWFVDTGGHLRVVGDPTPDYLPQFLQTSAQRRALGPLSPPVEALGGAVQGLAPDTLSSGARLGGYTVQSSADWAPFSGISSDDPTVNLLPGSGATAAQVRQGFADQRHAYDIANVGSPYAQAGRFTGQAVPSVAAGMAVPEIEAPAALGTLGRIAATGATNALRGVAATAPVVGTNPAPVAQQLATGALAGVAVPPILDAAGNRVANALVGKTVAPEVAQLADTAVNKYGIPLRAGQISGVTNETDRYADNALLGTSPKFQANNAAQRDAWMKGVTGTYGDDSGSVAPDALQASKNRIGGVMNDVAARTAITNPDAVQTQISQIIADAQKVLPENEVAPLLKLAQNIGDVREGNIISGDAYQALTRSGAPLDRLTQSADPNLAHYASQIRSALDDGLQASAAPEDTDALQNARWQYKNLQAVARIAPKADVNGNIPPALLRGAVSTNFKNQAFQGAGDLGELAQIGQAFLKEPPQSGTVPRAKAALGLLGLIAGAGGEAAAAFLHNPELGFGTAAGLAGSAAVRRASDALQALRLGPQATPALIQRSLSGAPRPVASTLGALGNVARPIQIPLSALGAARIPPINPDAVGLIGGTLVGSAFGYGPVGPAVGSYAQ